MRCAVWWPISSVQDRVIVPSLDVAGDTAIFSYAVYQPGMESADQITDGAIACAVNAIRALLGADWAPTEVLLPRGQPADTEPYRRHFRAPVRFDQEIAALVFPSRCLELRIAGADPLLRAMLEERIKQLKGAQGSEFPDDIRRLLRVRLTSNRCSADDIADLLAMHRRTLSRRLKEGGTGYRDISNEIRFELARQLLGDTEVPLGQIAAALDYSEASAFTRAFRRWSGETPTAWRARHRRDGQRNSHEPQCGPSQQGNDRGRSVDEEASDPANEQSSDCATTSSGTSGSRICVVRCRASSGPELCHWRAGFRGHLKKPIFPPSYARGPPPACTISGRAILWSMNRRDLSIPRSEAGPAD